MLNTWMWTKWLPWQQQPCKSFLLLNYNSHYWRKYVFSQSDLANKLVYFIYRFFQSLRIFTAKLNMLYPMYLQRSNTYNFSSIWLILTSKFKIFLIQIKLQIYLNGLNLPPSPAAAGILHAANIYKTNIFAGFNK